MRYFLKLAYDGGAFHGWQRQPNASSVQQTIEEALSTVMRRPTPIVGAGRTDTGVHARCMYAHFDVDSTIAAAGSMLRGLNRLV
ncbi:MAG: tRNA pseudouridine(38-40) synthase TruA, partial [Muribaculaceae bacterium]|nr:tRNA pseudouridine(38-40) synthase TruA [Muribaculaceae bacterium]